MSGYGSQPFGSSPFGIGALVHAMAAGGALLRDDTTGKTLGSRLIDPVARDYVLDVNGRVLGMGNARQLVLLAVSTDRGTSAMRSLGNLLRSIDRITPNFQRRVDFVLRDAVQDLVNRDLIEVLGTTVQVIRSGVAVASLRWRDLETGLADEVSIDPLRKS